MAAPITDIAAGRPVFVSERFEPAGEWLEVAGHWRGLRGRRFVRPVLWLHDGDQRRRLIAVLDHKPWAASDGEPWIAAFAWKGGRIDADRAELEVGSDLVVELPIPGAKRRRPKAKPKPAPAVPPAAPAERVASAPDCRVAELRAERDALRAERDELRAALDRATADAERARADGERLVNDEYRQRQRVLEAAEAHAARAREAQAAQGLAERQLAAARTSHAELERRILSAHDPATAAIAERERPVPELAPAPRGGAALWGARVVAVALVAALMVAVVLILIDVF